MVPKGHVPAGNVVLQTTTKSTPFARLENSIIKQMELNLLILDSRRVLRPALEGTVRKIRISNQDVWRYFEKGVAMLLDVTRVFCH